ncbi:hypothetical protein D4764_10G0006030 [Takifugu flavidus]|uniref:Uncharacterized protein n=1 Tax=Takifugu flavidus TaxID=433684 RepID=A0A5C6PJF4_9TELE|nr:hypothetical protein D4764_10G0006030 [Takifugu flavidus]
MFCNTVPAPESAPAADFTFHARGPSQTIPRPDEKLDGQTYRGNRRGKMQSVNAIIVIELTYLL